jgi:ribonuclease HI
VTESRPEVLRLYTDGAARGNPGPAAIGLVIEDGSGQRLWGGHGYLGTRTNNQAEYQALIAGLRKAAEWNPERLDAYMDSRLVVEQLSGRNKIKNPDLQELAREARGLLAGFPRYTLNHVPRERNRGADALANRALDEQKKSSAGRPSG